MTIDHEGTAVVMTSTPHRTRNVLIAGSATVAAAFIINGAMTSEAITTSSNAAIQPLTNVDLDSMQRSLADASPEAASGRFEQTALGKDGITPQSRSGAANSGFVVSTAPGREFRLYASTGAAAGDTGNACASVAAPAMTSCTKRSTGDGVETTQLVLSVLFPEVGPDKYRFIAPSEVTTAMLPDLRVERIVRLQRTDGGVVSARETVYGVSSTNYDAAFSSSVADLAAVVHDPTLSAELTN